MGGGVCHNSDHCLFISTSMMRSSNQWTQHRFLISGGQGSFSLPWLLQVAPGTNAWLPAKWLKGGRWIAALELRAEIDRYEPKGTSQAFLWKLQVFNRFQSFWIMISEYQILDSCCTILSGILALCCPFSFLVPLQNCPLSANWQIITWHSKLLCFDLF